ncbi:cytochrome P450 [Trichoderma longibrachiatum]
MLLYEYVNNLGGSHVATLAALGVSVLVVLLARLFRESTKGSEAGCKPVTRVRQWEPFLGLDMVYSQLQALKRNYYLEWLRNLHKGKPKTFAITFMGVKQICTTEGENLKAIQATNFKDFGLEPMRRKTKGAMPFADKGISTTDGKNWEFARFLVKPFFYREVYASIDRIDPYVRKFFTLLPEEDGVTFDIQPLIQRWFLDLTSEFIFGKTMDSMTYPDRADITWTMLDVLRGGRLRIQMYKFLWAFNWKWWLKAVYEVHDFVNVHIRSTYKELEQREQRIKDGLPVGPERVDLLWYMATHVRDEEELRSQLCLVFVPNNDTTSIFISNCIWHLARDREAWQKLRKEVLDYGDQPITFESLRSMPYLNGVLNETHRLTPNNIVQVRACLNDSVLPLGGGPDGKSPLYVNKGDLVSVTKTVMYRDPDVWGPDVDVFRPERFFGVRGNWNFLPFGGGPRRCPAQMMVQTESAYMLFQLAKRYSRLECRDPEPYTAVMRIGPSNVNGVKIAFYE